MAKLNIARRPVFTHEGAKAKRVLAELQLRRSVLLTSLASSLCSLWQQNNLWWH